MPTINVAISLDRASNLRADRAWLECAVAAVNARTMLLVDLKPAIRMVGEDGTPAIRWFARAELEALELAGEVATFLGLDEHGRPHFALSITEHRARTIPDGPYALRPYAELRGLAVEGRISPADLSLIGEARALACWHRTSRCCGHCGSTNRHRDGGWRLQCWSCGQNHFPRMDPVVIMLVTRGERCLLARGKNFPKGVTNFPLFSALAGFLEPGETIEAAVRREVAEEVGLEIGAVRYLESQPWPFPHSLMIGCLAEATTCEVAIDHDEIVEARWLDRGDVARMLGGERVCDIDLPGRYAIARKLVIAFAEGGS